MIPTSTNVKIAIKGHIPADADAVAVLITEGAKLDAPRMGERERSAAERLLDGGIARGKAREVARDLIEMGKGKLRRVYVAGLGPGAKANADSVRQAAGAVVRAARQDRVRHVAILVGGVNKLEAGETCEALVVGALLASFQYREYVGTVGKKKLAEENRDQATALTLVGEERAIRPAAERGRVLADAQNYARTIASRPGNDVNPVSLVKVAQQLSREAGLKLRVLDEKQMEKLGMGGILGVGGGSATPPRLIVLEHAGAGATRRRSDGATKGGKRADGPLLVVGKTITFDTGGVSIKPAQNLHTMIHDKCGGMTVLGLMYAVGKLKLPRRVVGILTCAENHVSADAYRPGDILRMYNGVTVEVTNTDAEGRLVLGDALSWGIEQYKPAAVVDLATLTGAMIVALGKTIAGVMSNDDGLAGELSSAAERAAEKVWRMPLYDEHREQLESIQADIVNSAGRDAGALVAGAFLSHFVPEGTPWAHMDIAGVVSTEKDLPYYGKGATGWGVRTLVEWVERSRS
jgi:leucyl aminopeptidase